MSQWARCPQALDALSAAVTAQAEDSADTAETAPHPVPGSARRQVWREPVHDPLPTLMPNAETKQQTWIEA